MEPLRANGKLETIKRLRQRINEIMFYAVNIGLIEANPAVKIKDAFEMPQKRINTNNQSTRTTRIYAISCYG